MIFNKISLLLEVIKKKEIQIDSSIERIDQFKWGLEKLPLERILQEDLFGFTSYIFHSNFDQLEQLPNFVFHATTL